MKRVTGAILALALLTALAGCAPRSAGSDAAAGAAASPAPGTAGAGALPIVTQLVVGTLRLEEGDLAVGAEQAAALLPLWKGYLALSADDSSSSVEVEALESQLQETMTAEQMEAITAMSLTAEDMVTLIADLGIGTEMMGGRDGTSGTAGGGLSGGAGFPGGGGMPGGGSGFPGGGGGGFPGGAPPAGAAMMPGAVGGAEGSGDGIPRRSGVRMLAMEPLIQKLIDVLESKA